MRNARAGRLLSAGVRIVLAGSPNTGKSSLLNCLLREQRAIVTDVAGTTRDVLREELDLFGLPVQLSDTAGLRSAEDAVERIGIDRAREELRRADVALLVLDSARELTLEERSLLRETSVPLVVALNKTDLNARTGVEDVRAALQGAQAFAILLTSAVTGEGIEALRRALYEAALRGASPEEAYLTNERHVQAAKDALAALESAVTALEDRTLDCAALDLRAAWEALGAITGESATEDVIDRIFEKFCLGK